MTPQLVMLAGPNGAGKSTFYDRYLASSPLPFLNADLVAATLQIDSFEAARVLDGQRAQMIAERAGFITETVFSDPHGAKLDMLRAAVAAGFETFLIYVGIASPELSERRIEQRLARGGHDAPRDRLKSRFERSLANLKAAVPLVSLVDLYDNSSVEEPYRLIATFENGTLSHRAPGRLPRWCAGVVPVRRSRS